MNVRANGRVAAVWAGAIGSSAVLAALALHAPSPHRAPSLSSGPLFAVPANSRPVVLRGAITPVTVRLDDRGCQLSTDRILAGPVTFTVVNPGDTKVNEAELSSGTLIMGEAEGVDPGSTRTFSLELDAGTYYFGCPGTGAPATPLTVVAARG